MEVCQLLRDTRVTSYAYSLTAEETGTQYGIGQRSREFEGDEVQHL